MGRVHTTAVGSFVGRSAWRVKVDGEGGAMWGETRRVLVGRRVMCREAGGGMGGSKGGGVVQNEGAQPGRVVAGVVFDSRGRFCCAA